MSFLLRFIIWKALFFADDWMIQQGAIVSIQNSIYNALGEQLINPSPIKQKEQQKQQQKKMMNSVVLPRRYPTGSTYNVDWHRTHKLMYAIASAKKRRPRRMCTPILVTHALVQQKGRTKRRNSLKNTKKEEDKEEEENEGKKENNKEEEAVLFCHVFRLNLVGERSMSFSSSFTTYDREQHGDDQWMSIDSKEWTTAETHIPNTIKYQVQRLSKKTTAAAATYNSLPPLNTNDNDNNNNNNHNDDNSDDNNNGIGSDRMMYTHLSGGWSMIQETDSLCVDIHLPIPNIDSSSFTSFTYNSASHSKEYFRTRCMNRNGWSDWSGTLMCDTKAFTRKGSTTTAMTKKQLSDKNKSSNNKNNKTMRNPLPMLKDVSIHQLLTNNNGNNDGNETVAVQNDNTKNKNALKRLLIDRYTRTVPVSTATTQKNQTDGGTSSQRSSIFEACVCGDLRTVQLWIARDYTVINSRSHLTRCTPLMLGKS